MPKKLTKEEWIKKAKIKHGDKYDYSKVKYVNMKTRIDIKCNVDGHGIFKQTPHYHSVRGYGCPKCAGNYQPTTEEWIKKAKIKHGENKYDYTEVNYINSNTDVIIKCNVPGHGIFKQTPHHHSDRGDGCPKCSNTYQPTTEEWIEKAKSVHGETYDYTKVNYINNNTDVIIMCKVHGIFKQTPYNHSNQGCGCPKCAGNYQPTTEEWIKKAKIKHGENKYDYTEVNYINAITEVIIICNVHGIFKQLPVVHEWHGCGCPKCGNSYQPTTEEWIEKAKSVHGETYDYKEVNYINAITDVIIMCKVHGIFTQTPRDHSNDGCGCPKCAGNYRPTTEEWIKKAKIKHGENKYDYSEVIYIGAYTDVIIKCNVPGHGTFEQTPSNHSNHGCGCPKCSKQYSKMQIEWLNYISIKDKIIIQHAENEGEFIIPNTRFKADGYCKETNTIYEFHGDYWHGNPLIFDQNEEFHNGTTFGELYEKTIEREKQIKDMGFNLIVMWENDWKKLNKFVKILQRSYRKKKNIKIK